MAKELTFIHAADLHIGASFRGFQALSERWARRLMSAISESYDRVVDTAINNKVDFVIIAGDVFDTSRASYADYLHFFEGLKRLDEQNIPVYICTGNHDPFTSWQQDIFAFPPNTTMLSADKPGFAVFEKEGEPYALIAGRGFYNQAWPKDEDIAAGITRAAAIEATGVDAPFAIGVLHSGLHLDPEKAPTNPRALMQTGIDYWALGHIHIKYVFPDETNPRVVFSGCVQGRDIKETGERGVFKVSLKENMRPQLEFIPTASVVWQQLEIDVSLCGSLGEIVDKVLSELFYESGKAHCEEMCVRITLTGKTELHKTLCKPEILEGMRKNINDAYPVFFCDALVDKTMRPHDRNVLTTEGLFPAVFLQAAESFAERPEEEIAYLEDEFLKRGFPLPRECEHEINGLTKDAEMLVLDLLDRGDEA